MKSETEKYQQVCTEAGVAFIEEDGQFVFFQDTITKQTLKVDKKDFKNAKVQAVVTVHRRSYPKHIELHADITDAINFLTKKYYNIPHRTIADAALAATLVIQNYINEQTPSPTIDPLPLGEGRVRAKEGAHGSTKIAA